MTTKSSDKLRVGDFDVARLGYGAIRLTGNDVWGRPSDPDRARAVLRRAVDLGVELVDTAWFYGPHVTNRLIAETLYPYPKQLVIATKLGSRRTKDKGWAPFARPKELRDGAEHDLRDLKRDVLDVVHFRFMGRSGVPFLESLDGMMALQKAGKIRHIALSGVGVTQLQQALERTAIVAVQNLFNVAGGGGAFAQRTHSVVDDPEGVLALCEQRGIAFLPYFPLASGALGKPHPAFDMAAKRHGATAAQIALAWLLARSPVMLPIPGTNSLAHLEENWNAQTIRLSQDEVEAIAREARA
jgi:aryl-alcohol dehydrogenase-like predicted oxidoreductase